jgi:hypothetical protein
VVTRRRDDRRQDRPSDSSLATSIHSDQESINAVSRSNATARNRGWICLASDMMVPIFELRIPTIILSTLSATPPAACSERLYPGAQFDLPAPRAPGLLQDLPVGLRNRIRIKHAVGPVRGLDP